MNRQKRAGAIALAWTVTVAGGAITGCTVLLDAGSYKVGPSDAGTSDAGTCTPSMLPTNSTTFQNIVNSCILAVSCDPFYFQVTISTCISEVYLQSVPSPSDSCLSTVSNCADYAGCAKQSIPTLTQCPTTSKVAFCDSSGNAVNCGADTNASSYVKNCTARGQTCTTYNDGSGIVADCLVPGTCTETDANQHCDTSNNLYTCVNGVKYGDSCNLLNGTCKEDTATPSNTLCYFNGTSCTTPGYTCEPDGTGRWCTSGNVLFKFNCTAAGLTCALNSSSTADCVAPGCTTSDYDNCTESCSSDGHTANLCVGGAQFPVDCKTYGFKTCTDTMSTHGIYCSY